MMKNLSTFRLPFKNKPVVDSDVSDVDETGDGLGSLPQFNKIEGGGIPTAPPDDSEYGLSIPMSISSMSFSASTEGGAPSANGLSELTFNRLLADDHAPKIGTDPDEFLHADEFSAYLSRHSTFTDFSPVHRRNSTFTDFTTSTAATNLTLDTNADNNAGLSELFGDSTFSVVTGFTTDTDAAGLKTNATGFSTDRTTSSTVPTPLVPNTATSVTTSTTSAEPNAGPTLATQLVPSEQARTKGAAKDSVFACFADLPWLKLLSFASKDDGNTAEKAIVGISQSSPIASPFSPSEKMSREDILRMAIATALNMFAESEEPNIAGCVNFYMDMTGSSTAGTSSTPYRPGGANTSLVVRKACSDTLYQSPAPAPSPEDTPAPVIAHSMSSGTAEAAEDKSRSSRASRASRASKTTNGGSDGSAVVSVEYTETGKKTLAKLQEECTETGNKAKSPMFARTRSHVVKGMRKTRGRPADTKLVPNLSKKHPKATPATETEVEHTEAEVEDEADVEHEAEVEHESTTKEEDEAEVEHESKTKEDDARDESIHELDIVNDDSSNLELNTVNDDGNVAFHTETFTNDPTKSTRGLETNAGYIKRRSSIWSKDLRPGRPGNPDVAGCINFYSDMLFSSADFAPGVLLELEMNGVFPKAAEKFDALDEDSQIRFVNSHNRQLISRTSPGREKQVAFYHAFLHLVSTSTQNAVQEISAYDFASSCSDTKGSTEKGELAATKAVAKIIEADIIEELENDDQDEISSLHSFMTDANLSRFGVEIPYEQYQALQKSKSPFHFDFSKYVHAVKKARAHLSTRRATVTTRKDQKHVAAREKSSAVEQTKIADIEAKPTDDISYDDDTATRLLLEAEAEEDRSREEVESGKQERDEMFSIPDCANLASMMTAAAAKREGLEMISIPDCTDLVSMSNDLVSMMTAAVSIKNNNERESAPTCEKSSEKSENDHNPTCEAETKEKVEEKKPAKKEEGVVPEKKTLTNKEARDKKPIEKKKKRHEKKEKRLANKEIEKKKHIEKEEDVVPEKKTGNAEAEDITMRILKDHVKRKRKIEQARKKAIQELLQQSRPQPIKAPNARSSKGASKKHSSPAEKTKNRSSSSTSSRSSSSRTKTSAQRNYKQVSTGLKKTPRVILVKSSE